MHTPAEPEQGGERVNFVAVLDQVIALLRQRSRLTYRTLQSGSSSSTRWRWRI